jgi:hypothetical protein
MIKTQRRGSPGTNRAVPLVRRHRQSGDESSGSDLGPGLASGVMVVLCLPSEEITPTSFVGGRNTGASAVPLEMGEE